jgi:hypothetical protein
LAFEGLLAGVADEEHRADRAATANEDVRVFRADLMLQLAGGGDGRDGLGSRG